MARTRGNNSGNEDYELPSDVGSEKGPSIFDIASKATHDALNQDEAPRTEDRPITEDEQEKMEELLDQSMPHPSDYPENNNEHPLPEKEEPQINPSEDQDQNQELGLEQNDQGVAQDAADAPSAQSGGSSESSSSGARDHGNGHSSDHAEEKDQAQGQSHEQDQDQSQGQR